MNKPIPFSIQIGILASIAFSPPLASAQTVDANAIVKSVSKNRQISGFEVRARIVTEGTSGSKPETKQIVIKGRHVDGRKLTLYQAYWPSQWKGHAVVIETRNGDLSGGYFFEPPNKVVKLDRGSMGKSVLGSSLTVEDVSEFFWDWPNPKFVERTRIGKSECAVIEFRAPQGTPSDTRMIRAWVDEKVNLPIRIEKFNQSGRATTRIHMERFIRTDEGGWAPGKLRIESLGTGKQTHLIPSRGKRDITVPEGDFSVESLRKILSPNRSSNP